jgi:4-aminobutyrate aminotransferase-like enzyme
MLRRPELRTALPGPIASSLIERDSVAMSPSFTRAYPFVMDHGEGCWATDVDGNTFLDFTAGIAVCSTGHSHPRVVEAITDQARRFLHMSGTDFYYRGEIELAERLASAMLPGTAARVFFTNSGAEAVEGAMKLARHRPTQLPGLLRRVPRPHDGGALADRQQGDPAAAIRPAASERLPRALPGRVARDRQRRSAGEHR